MASYALTTEDNPFDPFDQFKDWLQFDKEKGYDCCDLLGRIAYTSEQLSDTENDEEIEQAIDRIVSNIGVAIANDGTTTNYKKVLMKE